MGSMLPARLGTHLNVGGGGGVIVKATKQEGLQERLGEEKVPHSVVKAQRLCVYSQVSSPHRRQEAGQINDSTKKQRGTRSSLPEQVRVYRVTEVQTFLFTHTGPLFASKFNFRVSPPNVIKVPFHEANIM